MASITTLTVTGMHCGSCGMLIDEVMEDVPGERSSATDVKAGRTTVEHDDTVDAAAMVAAVAEAGYAVSAIT